MSFRRAKLLGSEELFRPTRPAAADDPDDAAPNGGRPGIGHLVTLSTEEIRIVAQALQMLKYPERLQPASKLPLERFEALENLRKKLLEIISDEQT